MSMKKRCLVTKAITIQNLGMNTHSVDSQDSRKVEKRFLEPMPFLYGTDEMVPPGRSYPRSITCFTAWLDLQLPCKSTCKSLLSTHFPALSCTFLHFTTGTSLVCAPEPDLS